MRDAVYVYCPAIRQFCAACSLAIDYLKSDNPDYFLMPLRRFLGKSGLRRHEMDMLMGICRQVDNLRKEAGK